MGKSEIVKCRSSHCLHKSKELLREEAVSPTKSVFYHRDCYQTQEDIKEIIDIFYKQINPNVVFSQLRHVINIIVYDRGVSSELLLFGLKYYIQNRKTLNYPQGLYYVIQNKEMINAFNKYKVSHSAQKIQITEDSDETFQHIPAKSKGFADILQ